jgi:hypothetical protein
MIIVASVIIRKQKRPSGSLTWGAHEVGADDRARWLFTPEGSTCTGVGRAGEVGWSYVGEPDPPGLAVLQIIPADGWWIAHASVRPSLGRCVAVDICTPCARRDDVWVFDDLELDVVWCEGEVVVEDEAELVAACSNGSVDEHEASVARRATDAVCRMLADGIAPLDESIWSRLASAAASDLEPILHHRNERLAGPMSRGGGRRP